jgi:putative polyhydroxyalkanoate system protein
MPKLSVSVPHKLTQEEATRRLKESSMGLKGAFAGQVSDLEEEWDGDEVRFGFAAMGMKVKGTVTSEPSQVTVNAELPIVAMMLKGTIEQQIRDQLGKVLA